MSTKDTVVEAFIAYVTTKRIDESICNKEKKHAKRIVIKSLLTLQDSNPSRQKKKSHDGSK